MGECGGSSSGQPSARVPLRALAARSVAQARSGIVSLRERFRASPPSWARTRTQLTRTWTELRQGSPLGFAATAAWIRDRDHGVANWVILVGVSAALLFELHADIVARVFNVSRGPFRLTDRTLVLQLVLASIAVAALALHHLRARSRSSGEEVPIRWSWVLGSIAAAMVAVVVATLVTAIVVGAVAVVVFLIFQLVVVLLYLVALLAVMLMISELLRPRHPVLAFVLRAPAGAVISVVATLYFLLRSREERSD